MSAALSSRVSSGGITKRTGGGGRARVDRDGDLDMDAPAGGRGRGRGGRGGRRAGARPANINSAPKGPAAERGKVGASGSGVTRTRTSGRKEPINNRSRAGTSTKKVGPTGPTVGVRVQGWKESKGSAEECVRFLERKTNLRFRKVRHADPPHPSTSTTTTTPSSSSPPSPFSPPLSLPLLPSNSTAAFLWTCYALPPSFFVSPPPACTVMLP